MYEYLGLVGGLTSGAVLVPVVDGNSTLGAVLVPVVDGNSTLGAVLVPVVDGNSTLGAVLVSAALGVDGPLALTQSSNPALASQSGAASLTSDFFFYAG